MRYTELLAKHLSLVEEIFPWDLEYMLEQNENPLLLDVREPAEFAALHVKGSVNVPRGVLETACEWDFEDTVPELVEARNRRVAVICHSGNRSVFAAHTLQQLGYRKVSSLKTGLRGWNDYELPLEDTHGQLLSQDQADKFFIPRLRPEQRKPNTHA